MTAFEVTHTTRYLYGLAASLCHNQAHLMPRITGDQWVASSEISIHPVPRDRADRIDLFGNHSTFFSIQEPHRTLEITCTSRIERRPTTRSAAEALPWELARDAAMEVRDRDLVLESPNVPLLGELSRVVTPVFWPGRPIGDAVADLGRTILETFRYEPGFTTVSTPLSEVLEHRRGVCQDFAHLTIACLRSLGLAARYVSGYIESILPGDERQQGAEASHAWCAVRLADGIWLDVDPTNDVVAPDHHLTVAWGRDYSDVVPVQGVVLSADGLTQLTVEVSVDRK